MSEEEQRKKIKIIGELLDEEEKIEVKIDGYWAIMTPDKDKEENKNE